MHVSTPITDSNSGIIFIPDISGFTQFIKKTEIIHSQHIITELLELIIKETGNNFSLSEIEGDAVLFYNTSTLPDYEKIKLLCITIFKKFHRHLKYYVRDRICQCGACSSTENLSLKFILHYGTITRYLVGGHQKLLGEDLIIAHRLLKNSITNSEYILFSDDFIKASKLKKDQVKELNISKENLESIGNSIYYYQTLLPFKKDIEEPPPRSSVVFPNIKIGPMQEIKAQPKELLSLLAEPELRIKWMKGLKKFTLKNQKINRILSSHECLIGSNQLEVAIEEVIANDLGGSFFERVQMNRPRIEFIVLYQLGKKNDKITQIGIGNHFFKTKNWAINLFFLPILALRFKRINNSNLKRLKKYIESIPD